MLNISYDSSGDLHGYDDENGVTYVYNGGDIAWTLASTALVWIMIPGVGFLYSGLLRRKNALSMIWASMTTLAVVSFQWFFWGFSLTFSETSKNPFIGNLRYIGLNKVLVQRSTGSPRVPQIVFCVFQLMFAAITPALAIGAVAERSRLGPLMVFVFLWSTLVYDPIAYWNWNFNGWSNVLGGLDFAGGTPVHISSGTAALAISLFLGKRTDFDTRPNAFKAHNATHVVLGTVFLWFGWFGFNGGSALSANLRATNACIVTNTAASVGGLTWMVLDWSSVKKWSAVSFCTGAIAGLVAITPASGYVGAPASVLFGVVAGTFCNFATQIKKMINCDDAHDIFAVHAIGGLLGNLLTGIFAQKSIAASDGFTSIPGGWLDHHWKQLAIQLADSVAGLAYTFFMTLIILGTMHIFPPLRLLCLPEEQDDGIDKVEMAEFAYDYVSLQEEIEIPAGDGQN